MATYNASYDPRANLFDPKLGMLQIGGSVDDAIYNYAPAFSGVEGLTTATKGADGNFTLVKPAGGDYDYRATASIGDGGLVNIGDWKKHRIKSTAEMATEFGALAALAATGLNAAGFLGQGAGAAGAAGAGEITGGSGLLAGTGGSGLAATAGEGLTLAGTTGTGAGLAAGTGSNLLGAGIGASIPGGSLLGAGGSSGVLDTIINAATRNPRLTAGVVGGLLGGSGVEEEKPEDYKGPMPTITRGGWKPSVTPTYMPFNSVASLIKIPKRGK